MKIRWRSIAHATANYMAMHLFLTIVSLPILVAWGLPISALSPIGNFIFSPLLSSFLLVCSLAFFSELFSIPHGLLDWIIEKMATIWYWMLNQAPQNLLFGLYAPSPWLLALIAFGTIIAIVHPALHSSYHRLQILTFIFLMTMILLAFLAPSSIEKEVTVGNESITLIRHRGKTIIIDNGGLAASGNGASWAAYTFMPELIKTTGSLTIDYLIVTKPSITACQVVARLLDDAAIGHLYFPALKGTLEGSFKRAFNALYARVKSKSISFTRTTQTTKEIHCGTTVLTLAAGKERKYQTITYCPLTIERKNLLT